MKIEIYLNDQDLKQFVSEYCREKFDIDPKGVDIRWAEPGGKNLYHITVEGDYCPEKK